MDGEKSQPQELLEEVIGITHGEPRGGPLEEVMAMDATPFTCPICLKQFKNAQAVRMHKARVHDKTIRTPKKHPFEVPEGGVTKTLRPIREGETMLSAVTGRPIETLDTQRKKWSLKRRKRYNAKRKAEQEARETSKVQERTENWHRITPQLEEEALIRFCPCCGKNIERFLS